MLDESAPVRLETAPTGEGRCLFIFRIHYKTLQRNKRGIPTSVGRFSKIAISIATS